MAGLIEMELLIRAARVVTIIQGALVMLDSIGILVSAREQPPHKAKWSAASWLIMGLTLAGCGMFLVSRRAGLVNVYDPFSEQVSVFLLWTGMALALTLRAISRAHRPWLIMLSTIGMSVAGVCFALELFA